MQFRLSGVDLGLALVDQGCEELMVVLATVADADMQADGALVTEIAGRHNGTAYHALVAPFLRQLADAIEGRGAAIGRTAG